jgi:hypothetical protein
MDEVLYCPLVDNNKSWGFFLFFSYKFFWIPKQKEIPPAGILQCPQNDTWKMNSRVSRNEDGDKEFLGVSGADWTRVIILLVEIKSTWYVFVCACFLLCFKRCHVCVDIGGPNWVIWRPKFPNHTSPTSRPDRHAPPPQRTSIGAYWFVEVNSK